MANNNTSDSPGEGCRIFWGTNSSLDQGNQHPKLNLTCIYFLCSSPNQQEWYCYTLISMCFLSLVFGFLGNVTVLINYVHYTKSWTSSTIFIFNLALCDLTWIIIVPVSVFFSLDTFVPYSVPVFCQFKRVFFNINVYGSIFFLTLISFDRYLSSMHPLTSPRWWNKKKAKLCTITIWLFIFGETVPDIYCIITSKYMGKMVTCLDLIEEPMSFVVPITVFRMLLGFLIPGTVICKCYFSTLKVLTRLKDHCHTRRLRKPLILVTATMIVFLISFAPYHIMMMVILFYRCSYSIDSRNVKLIFAFYEISQILCSVSNCADPILFILANRQFKHHIKALKCSCCRTNRVGPKLQ